MKLQGIECRIDGDRADIALPILPDTVETGERRIHFRLPAGILGGYPPSGDFAIPVTLLLAMKRGEDLEVSYPVCGRMRSAVPVIQDMYAVWGYAPRRVALRLPGGGAPADSMPKAGNDSRGVACFFTGGTDSWYTLIKHQAEISHLVYVHGFDVKLDDAWRRGEVSRLVRKVGAALGKQVIELETDLRSFSDPIAKWDDYHGAALASVALLLGNAVRKVFIPGTFTYADLVPLGSHPMLDPLWSTEAVTLVHDGCEASRLDKVRFIAGENLVRETLRVCWRNVGQSLNCGVCEKCLRTMICLEISGLKCDTFPQVLDLAALETLAIKDRWRVRYEQMRVGAELANKPELAAVLAKILKGPQFPAGRAQLLNWLRSLVR